jgi:hypothetical protein
VVINQQALSTPLQTQLVIPTPEASIMAPDYDVWLENWLCVYVTMRLHVGA